MLPRRLQGRIPPPDPSALVAPGVPWPHRSQLCFRFTRVLSQGQESLPPPCIQSDFTSRPCTHYICKDPASKWVTFECPWDVDLGGSYSTPTHRGPGLRPPSLQGLSKPPTSSSFHHVPTNWGSSAMVSISLLLGRTPRPREAQCRAAGHRAA